MYKILIWIKKSYLFQISVVFSLQIMVALKKNTLYVITLIQVSYQCLLIFINIYLHFWNNNLIHCCICFINFPLHIIHFRVYKLSYITLHNLCILYFNSYPTIDFRSHKLDHRTLNIQNHVNNISIGTHPSA